MLEKYLPKHAAYMQLMQSRISVQKMEEERAEAMNVFLKLNVKYDG